MKQSGRKRKQPSETIKAEQVERKALPDAERRNLLKEYEEQIAKADETEATAFYEVWRQRLYFPEWNSFEAYLDERWPDISRATAYRYIDHEEMSQRLAELAPETPEPKQCHVGPLKDLKNPHDQAHVWRQVSAAHKKPTRKQVAEAVEQLQGKIVRPKTPAPTKYMIYVAVPLDCGKDMMHLFEIKDADPLLRDDGLLEIRKKQVLTAEVSLWLHRVADWFDGHQDKTFKLRVI